MNEWFSPPPIWLVYYVILLGALAFYVCAPVYAAGRILRPLIKSLCNYLDAAAQAKGREHLTWPERKKEEHPDSRWMPKT
jgi:hypothetical protein